MKGGRLSFKGDNPLDKRKKKKRKSVDADSHSAAPEEGWVPVESLDDVNGPIIIVSTATESPSALTCSDSSAKVTFSTIPFIGSQCDPSSVAQVFVTKRLPDSRKVSFKNAFDKYLSADKFGVITCEREAMGPAEEWELIFREDGVALQTCWEKFLSCDENGVGRADSDNAGFQEIFTLHCQAQNRARKKKKKDDGNLDETSFEVEQIKKFHSYGGGRLVLSHEDAKELQKAKKEGSLHEAMLDRRAKMKSDKFCK
ncbi:FRG1-like family-domain-containing protein [Gaertneriomyces semiglobifer]|nr:FRG1-like family-domain-containing protein [Gaertneriomyces semiglobifer]